MFKTGKRTNFYSFLDRESPETYLHFIPPTKRRRGGAVPADTPNCSFKIISRFRPPDSATLRRNCFGSDRVP